MKKTLSLILALVMIAAMFAVVTVSASAADATVVTDTWDGTADTSWYDASKTEFTLTTAEQLAGLAKLVNEAAKGAEDVAAKNFDGVTIKLGADIILNEGTFTLDADKKTPLYNGAAVTDAVKEWTPIGEASNDGNTANVTKKNSFWGNFDGQGHTISGIYINQPDAQQMGLFAKFSGLELKNVKIANSYICGDSRMGSLVGFVANENAEGRDILIENVSSSAIVVAEASNKDIRTGGMIGMFRRCENVTVKGMEFTGTVSGFGGSASDNAMLIGGLVGVICGEDAAETYTFENCTVNAAMYLNNTQKATNAGDRRTGVLMGCGYKFYGSFINCTANVTDTNITEENGFTDTNRLASLVGYYENVGNWTFTDCSFNHIGAIKKGLGGASMPDDCIINGQPATWWNGLSYGDIPGATNHVAADVVAGKAPTCTEAGTISYYVCPTCNACVNADTHETALSLIAPPAHNLGEWVEAKDPTLDAAGVLGHYQCTGCQKYFDADKNELASIEGEPKLTTATPTTKAPTTNPPATNPPAGTDAPAEDKKSCGGFTAIGAVLALVAVTGAAIVIKKK